MFFANTVFSQQVEKKRDSTSTSFSFGKLDLPDPNSIESKYEYDPEINKYKFSESIDGYSIRYPLYLTPQEYDILVRKEQMRDYFKEKENALNGKGVDAEEKRKRLLPVFYVNSNFFESVFGSNEIEINPQGSVEVDLGGLYNKQDNPAFSPRNQSNFTFDFDQRISLSLQGNIGTRLSVLANFDTESTFDFQNQLKLQYNPTEDAILQAIEVGNINLPLNSSLIQGAQSLFGVKVQAQFGKTTVTGVFSEQRSDTRRVTVQGGGTVQDYEIFALDYDENRHYFLSHFFRDTYDRSLANYPFINSNVQITRIQVWITNRTNNTQALTNARNLVAIQDLGESNPENIGFFIGDDGSFNPNASPGFVTATSLFPQNANNRLNPENIGQANGLTEQIRDIATVEAGFSNFQGSSEGLDYSILENARLLSENQYTLNPQLGYISLNQRLNNDEILAVAFQYTRDGQVFQVGEFANDGISGTQDPNSIVPVAGNTNNSVAPSQNLVVKTLKSSITAVNEPVWDLMMKNIYSLGAFQLDQQDFNMNIFYTDPSPVNFLEGINGQALPADISENTLLQLFNLDNLNVNNDPVNGGDGFFDFFPGITVDTQNGRIIFTSIEPFGEFLFDRLNNTGARFDDSSSWNPNQNEYVFNRLYSTTKIEAEQEQADKNKFQLKGRYTTSGQNGISIGAFNVPRGSVTVTAGGRLLQEGLDYTVNYQLGRVEILDPALQASNIPIEISTENNAVFGQQTKRYSGINVEHRFSKDFVLGGTLLNLKERPLTQKSNLDFEPINNTILGINGNYATEVPFLTRLVNKLPNIDTEVPSNFSFRGEFAYLFANAPDAADFNGEVTSYIDDFEGAQTRIDISSPLQWELSSVPIGFDNAVLTDPSQEGVQTGFKRAALSWYTIDQVFYSRQRPSGVSESDLSRPQTRRIFNEEIFRQRQIAQNQTRALFTLDLHYRPEERGPYNYNPALANNTAPANPRDQFGGITRALNTTNFEQSNIEFIEFWIMDPYEYTDTANSGQIRFNIGNISEDVLQDGRKQYENGLPEAVGDGTDTQQTPFGLIPRNQSLVYTFDSDGAARTQQDTGFDGLKNAEEQAQSTYGPFTAEQDPSADDYQFFLQSSETNIEDRYRRFNGTDGDSPTTVTDTNRGRLAQPTIEDVNRDNTMNTIDQYFEYTVDIDPTRLSPETNPLITDEQTFSGEALDGSIINSRWLQFKIPLAESDIRTAQGGSVDLRSARFMRMYLTGFNEEVLLRLASLDLVRGSYRTFTETASIPQSEEGRINFGNGQLSVSSVSVEENPGYVIPPGVVREQLNNNNQIIAQDERSLALTVFDLDENDSRAVFRNFNIDMRQYENLEMFLHAEQLPGVPLADGELTAIVRLGNDFTDNYYQIELPLELTPLPLGDSNLTADEVWPVANRLRVSLASLQRLKASVVGRSFEERNDLTFIQEGNTRIGIKGNPSFGNVRVLMLGVKNGSNSGQTSGQVWFNEMRLSGLKNQGGWAAVANADANIADFANFTVSGRASTIGFGSIEQGPNERSQEDLAQYDFTTSVNVGQLLPKKWGVKIPTTYSRGEQLITPQYDPLNQDLLLEDVLDAAETSAEKNEIENRSTEYTKRQSISVIGLRKERVGQKVPKPYDIENFNFSSTYNQTDHRDFEIEESLDQTFNLNGTYNYSFAPFEIAPLKKVKLLKSKHLSFIRDFNFNPLPTNVSFTSGINRSFNEQKFRDVSLTANSIQIDPLQQRNYLFNWQYALTFNLTKSLNFNFNANSNRVVRNFVDEENNVDRSVSIWDGLFETGIPNQLNQTLQANYELPFKKFTGLQFIQSSYSYTGDFQWLKGSEVFRNLEVDGEAIPDQGNTIQNSSVHRLNSTFDLNKLYQSIGLVKRTSNTKKKKKKKKKQENTQGPKIAPRTATTRKKKVSKKLKPSIKAYNTLVGIVTSLKRLNVNYQRDSGTVLPGYTNDIGFFGTLDPSAAFTFGGQSDIRQAAASRGYITSFQEFNGQYQNRDSERIDFRGTIDLLKGLKIDITGNRTQAETFTENFSVDNDLQYNSLTPNTFGNFSISSILLKTAFKSSGQDISETFDQFRNNRLIIANRLAQDSGIDPFTDSNNDGFADADADNDGFPDGFGPNNQAVLLPAFLAAYSGSSAEDVKTGAFRDLPLPNWNIRYTGLQKQKWFKKRFKRFSLSHAYQSNYTINQYQTNLEFGRGSDTDAGGNFKNELLLGNVNLTEQFSPLIKVDLETKGSVKVSTELRRDRALSFSFDNNLLTEVQGQEYILGLGYRIKDITFSTRLGGSGRKRVIKSDLNLKADLSLRQNETIIRNLNIDNSQITAGQTIYSIRFTSDYALSKNLTALFFYDHTFSRFAISTAFPQTNIRSGFTLRYNFGN